MNPAAIVSWLSAVPPHQDDTDLPKPPRKRLRLDDDACDNLNSDAFKYEHLPTPSLSNSGRGDAHMLASPSKRARQDQDDLALGCDLTPRPPRLGPGAEADTEGSVCSTSSYASKASKVSRNSSPTKQLFHAELQQTGFRQANFVTDQAPPSLLALRRELKRTQDGWKILPKHLEVELAGVDIPPFIFDDGEESNQPPFRYPTLAQVHRILLQASGCDIDGEGESSWNMEVHSPILDWALRDESTTSATSSGILDYRYCLSAGIIPQYKPKYAPSKMVDFCLAIRPEPEAQRIIDSARRTRPGESINQTDWGRLRKHPIAVSIETKRFGDQFDTALLQVATWHSSQWRSLRWGDKPLPSLEFLPGIIIQGHDWEFIATTLGPDDVATTFKPPLQIGNTRTEEGIYKLLVSLQQLKRWAEDSYWPAFKADVLGM